MHCVISGMRDAELPVRVDSVFALRSFVEACTGKLYLTVTESNTDLVF
jgi:hypothetical protein